MLASSSRVDTRMKSWLAGGVFAMFALLWFGLPCLARWRHRKQR
jgi:hypothetical protein